MATYGLQFHPRRQCVLTYPAIDGMSGLVDLVGILRYRQYHVSAHATNVDKYL